MKKVMFAAAVAADLVAFGDGIESANTVGYNSKSLEAGKFAIAAVQFEGMDGSFDINKLVSGLTGASYASDGDDFVKYAPQIQVPNGVGYDYYYYLTDGYYDGGKEKAGWCDANGTIAGDSESIVSGALIPGVAIWAKDVRASETMQQAGQVPTEDVTIQAPMIFALRANSYPIAFNLNDANAVTFSGLTPASYSQYGDKFVQYAPQIQVPNGVGYDYYYYLTDGYYDGGKEKAGWCDANGTIAGDAESIVTGVVPAGVGFWTKGVGSAFSITFKK